MKRTVLIAFIFNFFFLFAFSQGFTVINVPQDTNEDDSSIRVEYDSDNVEELLIRPVFTQNFLKRVESNLLVSSTYNLKSKGDKEKLLLGDFNAPVEFFFNPYRGNEGPTSLRIIKDSLNTWSLEVKYISNFKEVNRELSDMYPTIGMPAMEFLSGSIPIEEQQRIREHNQTALAKQNEERLKLYKADALLFPIGNHFAEQLYEKMVSLIVAFKVKEFVYAISTGGYSVSFRAVVDYEVWSLWISNPPDENERKMVELCRQIITDALANQLDESKYISILNTFENQ